MMTNSRLATTAITSALRYSKYSQYPEYGQPHGAAGHWVNTLKTNPTPATNYSPSGFAPTRYPQADATSRPQD